MNYEIEELFEDYYKMKANDENLYKNDFILQDLVNLEEAYSVTSGVTLSKVTSNVIDDFEVFHKSYYKSDFNPTNEDIKKMIL